MKTDKVKGNIFKLFYTSLAVVVDGGDRCNAMATWGGQQGDQGYLAGQLEELDRTIPQTH